MTKNIISRTFFSKIFIFFFYFIFIWSVMIKMNIECNIYELLWTSKIWSDISFLYG